MLKETIAARSGARPPGPLRKPCCAAVHPSRRVLTTYPKVVRSRVCEIRIDLSHPAWPTYALSGDSHQLEDMDLSSKYLILYNIVQALGWGAILVATVGSIVSTGSTGAVYGSAGLLVCYYQGLSLLETAHAALGLVRSGVAASLIQWVGRSHVLFAVLHQIQQLQSSVAVAPLFLAWSISEIIRYPWYAATLAGSCPPALTWLRYTAFIVLYPIGVVSEVWVLVEALPIVKATGMYGYKMPNQLNFGFDYYTFLLVTLAVYPFAWFQLYSQLLRARTKKLSKPKAQ